MSALDLICRMCIVLLLSNIFLLVLYVVLPLSTDGFASGGLGEVKPKERRKGYDEVLDILP